MSNPGQQLTQELLGRAHSPDTVNRIYADKIQHRALHLRASSPPPATVNARSARRKARQQKKDLLKEKPRPLSARQRRTMGLYDIPKKGQKYEIYQPLTKLWSGYAREILGADLYTGGSNAAAKLASAELHGAEAEVVRSRCSGRVGLKGIIVRDRKFVIELITRNRGLKMVPKEGTTFRIEVENERQNDSEDSAKSEPSQRFAFEVLGDQLMLRSADRANRKFKQHFLENV